MGLNHFHLGSIKMYKHLVIETRKTSGVSIIKDLLQNFVFRSQSQGYEAGFEAGKQSGYDEGYRLGWEKGSSISSEVQKSHILFNFKKLLSS